MAGFESAVLTKGTVDIPKVPGYSLLHRQDLQLTNLAHLKINGTQCEDVCNKIDGCSAFVESYDGANCYLKFGVPTNSNLVYNEGVYTRIKHPHGYCADNFTPKIDAQGSNCNINFTPLVDGADIAQYDLLSFNSGNTEACKQACKLTQYAPKEWQCKAISFNKNNGMCYLKSGWNKIWKNDDGRHMTSQFASFHGVCENDNNTVKRDATGSNCNTTYKMLPDTNMDWGNGNEIYSVQGDRPEINNTSRAQCSQICKSNPNCQAFVMNNAETTCWLRGNAEAGIFNEGDRKTFIQAPYGFCSDNTTMKLDAAGNNCYDYFDRVTNTTYLGTNYKNFKAESLNACESACKGSARCKVAVHRKSDNWCWLKERVLSAWTDSDMTSSVKSNFGKCPDGVTTSADQAQSNCFGTCPSPAASGARSGNKTAANDMCFGKCTVGDITQFKIDASGSNCFGKCTVGDTTKYKEDGTTNRGCFGKCTVGDTTQWKVDAEGSNCFGLCTVGDTTKYKVDASSNRGCFQKCTVGNTNEWKIDVSGSNCYGPCTNESPYMPWKAGPTDTHCFGPCDNDSSLWKLDASGQKGCYGLCTVGNLTEYKLDDEGSNCFGLCTKGIRTLYKVDATGSNCYGLCPEGSTYTYKRTSSDRCTSATGSPSAGSPSAGSPSAAGSPGTGSPGGTSEDSPAASNEDDTNLPQYCIDSPENRDECPAPEEEAEEEGEQESNRSPLSMFSKYLRRYFLERSIMGS
jgi:hypothetical protein